MDIMIDTEFLSFRMDSVILSIGAICFDIHQREFQEISRLYEVPTIDSQIHGKIDGSVFEFWMQQDKAVVKAITEHPDKSDIGKSLYRLKLWIDQFRYPDQTLRIWSHGAACDIPLLHHACLVYGVKQPWGHREPRDTRTLFDISPIDETYFTPLSYELQHHALYDALQQAKKVHASWQSLQAR